MKVILYMAISLNGIIARDNNEEDFLSEANWDTLLKLVNKSGCLIWGRKTYEIFQTWEDKYKENIKNIKKVIVSSDENFNPVENYEKTSSPKEALGLLEQEGFNEVILAGGAKLNSSFCKENLIDEIIFNIEPVVIGKGISVFSPDNFDLKLEFIKQEMISKNLVQLHYKVIK
ncbi:MAG: dihydrofolate reductase [Microgenomates group bacterium Gr01-1014_93]|nr:MAG: dihydrofolate reductase [Microgenomates group bacterium Gr01-1014_93]